ncbi:MAG TPA: HipA family kinase, partial [Silvibacterium sp.]|nr:HipA family kinase [Silvibacterium sp.]
MRGGAQGHLMLGADGNAYVVKFQNNPQHVRVLANELVATKLAAAAGLSAPACDVVDVTEWLVENTAELDLDFGPRRERCRPGLCFGSRLVGGLMPGHLFDYLPEEQLLEVKNLREFAGILAFDKWTCNVNGRQAVYSKKPREKRYTATFIDYGYCFNAGEWVFRDGPLRGVFARNVVYRGVTGWESLEPWLTRIEELEPQTIWGVAETVPPEWYGADLMGMESLVEELVRRRGRVRELISEFRESSRAPFPNWGKTG